MSKIGRCRMKVPRLRASRMGAARLRAVSCEEVGEMGRTKQLQDFLDGISEKITGKKPQAGNCPTCGQPVDVDDFKDELSLREYEITGTCQMCQDELEAYCAAMEAEGEGALYFIPFEDLDIEEDSEDG